VGESGRVFELCLSPVSTGQDDSYSRSTLAPPVVTGSQYFGREWLSPVVTGRPEYQTFLEGFWPPVATG
jgi:hypothetical protein